MLRQTSIALALTTFLLANQASTNVAHGQVNTPPPTGITDKLYAWTCRIPDPSKQRALAFHILTDASGSMTGKICMYKYSNLGGAKYTRKQITISGSAKDTIECQIVPVSGGFRIDATNVSSQAVPIGWASSVSDGKILLVRWKKDTVYLDGSPTAISSPCDEPPADDVGEEEQISIGSGNALPNTLPLNPGPRPTPPPTSGE